MRPVLAVFAALFLVSATPQQNVIPPAGETIEVSIVNLDVIVTDKDGKRVKGLTRDDFLIFDDGRSQPISNFAAYDEKAVPPAPARVEEGAAAKSVLPKRTIVVFTELLGLRHFDVGPFFEALRSTLHRLVRPGDDIMIVTWHKTQPITRLRYTDDLDEVDRVLAQLAAENGMLTPGLEGAVNLEREFYRVATELANSRGFDIDFSEGDPTLTEREKSETERQILIDKIAAIRSLIATMSSSEGKKVMILATHRLSRIAGKDVRTAAAAKTGARTILDVGMDLQRYIDELIRTANANEVTLYGLFPEGIHTDVGTSAEFTQSSAGGARDNIILDNELETLQLVANRTGGSMEWAAKKIIDMLPSIEEDLSSYYSLAFRVPGGTGERSRRVVVKTKDPSLRVRTRSEFVQKSDETRMRERVVSNLFRDVPGGTIPVELSHGPITQKGRNFRAALRVRVPVSSLMTVLSSGGSRTGTFSVYVGWNGVLGEIGEVTKETRDFQIKPREDLFTYDFELMLDLKTENVAVAVFDEVSKEYGVARLELPPRGEE